MSLDKALEPARFRRLYLSFRDQISELESVGPLYYNIDQKIFHFRRGKFNWGMSIERNSVEYLIYFTRFQAKFNIEPFQDPLVFKPVKTFSDWFQKTRHEVKLERDINMSVEDFNSFASRSAHNVFKEDDEYILSCLT